MRTPTAHRSRRTALETPVLALCQPCAAHRVRLHQMTAPTLQAEEEQSAILVAEPQPQLLLPIRVVKPILQATVGVPLGWLLTMVAMLAALVQLKEVVMLLLCVKHLALAAVVATVPQLQPQSPVAEPQLLHLPVPAVKPILQATAHR